MDLRKLADFFKVVFMFYVCWGCISYYFGFGHYRKDSKEKNEYRIERVKKYGLILICCMFGSFFIGLSLLVDLISQYMSEDPLGFNGGDLNLYAYVGNNPIMGVDPLGLCAAAASLFGNNQIGFFNFNATATNDLKAGTLKSSIESSVLHAGLNGSNANFAGTADVYKWRTKIEGGITNYANFSSTAKVAALEGETSGTITISDYYLKGTLGGSAGSVGYELKIGPSGVKAGLHSILGVTLGIEWGTR